MLPNMFFFSSQSSARKYYKLWFKLCYQTGPNTPFEVGESQKNCYSVNHRQ